MGENTSSHQTVQSTHLRKAVFVTVFLIFISILSALFWLYSYSITPGPMGDTPTAIVRIPQGSSFDRISEILVEEELIHRDIRFHILARLFDLSGKLRAGEFQLERGKLPLELLRDLSKAKTLQHKITFAEGLNGKEIAKILEENEWCTQEEFVKLINNPIFIAELGFEQQKSLEGYLYPDTYYLTRIPDVSAADIITRMVNRFKQIWSDLDHADNKLTKREVVILASIVEKETADPAERPRIASVFLNRLQRGMRLQSDPTVIYGVEDFNGNITRKDLKRATPYNTYVIPGLPIGPISNPGKDALAAVLNPANEDYLYFVSKNNGTHYFSKSLKEHNRAVRKYQKMRGN